MSQNQKSPKVDKTILFGLLAVSAFVFLGVFAIWRGGTTINLPNVGNIKFTERPTNTESVKKEEAEKVFDGFIRAWRKQKLSELKSYLSSDFNSTSFQGAEPTAYDNSTHYGYLQDRQNAFSKTNQIYVGVSDIKLKEESDGSYMIIYYQTYKSPIYCS